MLRYYILDENGLAQPCHSAQDWALWYERTAAPSTVRVLARDELGPEVCVSTVFLGIDHNWVPQGPPVLWETMVFGGEHDGQERRYTSRDAALQGHAETLALVTGAITSRPERAIRIRNNNHTKK